MIPGNPSTGAVDSGSSTGIDSAGGRYGTASGTLDQTNNGGQRGHSWGWLGILGLLGLIGLRRHRSTTTSDGTRTPPI